MNHFFIENKTNLILLLHNLLLIYMDKISLKLAQRRVKKRRKKRAGNKTQEPWSKYSRNTCICPGGSRFWGGTSVPWKLFHTALNAYLSRWYWVCLRSLPLKPYRLDQNKRLGGFRGPPIDSLRHGFGFTFLAAYEQSCSTGRRLSCASLRELYFWTI